MLKSLNISFSDFRSIDNVLELIPASLITEQTIGTLHDQNFWESFAQDIKDLSPIVLEGIRAGHTFHNVYLQKMISSFVKKAQEHADAVKLGTVTRVKEEQEDLDVSSLLRPLESLTPSPSPCTSPSSSFFVWSLKDH